MLYSLALQTLPMAALNNLPPQQTKAELHSLLQEPLEALKLVQCDIICATLPTLW